MQIKNGIVNGTLRVLGKLKAEDIFGDLTGNASSASSLLDSGDSTQLTMKRSAASLSNPTYLAGWNGNELRTVERTALTVGHATDASMLAGTAGSTLVEAPGAGTFKYYYNVMSSTTGLFASNNNANAIITFNKHSGNYYSQLGFSNTGEIYYRNFNGAALNNTTGWVKVVTDANISTVIDDTYVNVAGDTMTGVLHLLPNQYTDSLTSGALDLGNSNIYGVNSIYMADLADSAAEGIHFYRDSTHTDSLWAKSGTLYFSPNRTIGSGSSTDYTILHSNNYSSYALPLTGGTLSGLLYINRGSTHAPSIKWNKSGSHWGGIGYHGVSNENYFGPVDINGAWVEADATDTWTFRGYLKSTARATFPGASIGGYNNTTYALSTNSLICNSWIRTVGSTGWYNESYGGGWYMSDSTWIRSYGSKKVYVDNTTIDAIKTAGGVQAAYLGANGNNSNYRLYVNGSSYLGGSVAINGATTITGALKAKDSVRFYPFVGSSCGSKWYKVTLPYAGYSSSSNAWFMVHMELIVGGSYLNGSGGKIELSYYFNHTGSSDTFGAAQVRGFAYGDTMTSSNVEIRYSITNPGIFYIKACSHQYNSFAIQNLTANDTATAYDFSTTAIETCADANVIASGYTNVPITWIGTNDGTYLNTNNLLKITSNGNTMTIGSANGAWGHIENSADIPFYFNRRIAVDGNLYPYANAGGSLGLSTNLWSYLYNQYTITTGKTTIGQTALNNDYTLYTNGTSYFSDLITTSTGSGKGIKIGSTYLTAISGDLILQSNTAIRFGDSSSWDYNVWAGLKYVSASKAVYLGLADNSAFTANAAQTDGKLYIVNCHVLPTVNNSYDLGGSSNYWSRVHSRWIHANRGNSSTDGGVTLYDTSASYAILFRSTSNSGTHGYVTGDWATYFTMSDTANRGWVFRRYGNKNVFSISTDGNVTANGIGIFENGMGKSAGYLSYIKEKYDYNGSGQTGYIKITPPQTSTATMLQFTVNIYNYVEHTSSKYIISGYKYNTSNLWYNTTVVCLGKAEQALSNLTVRFCASSATDHIITIGEPTTSWSYVKVSISDITLGQSNTNATIWGQNWGITIATDAFANVRKTHSNTHVGYNASTNYVRDTYNDSTKVTFSYGKAGITNPSWYAAWNGYELRAISPLEVRKGISALGAVSDGSYYGIAEPDGTTSNWIRTTSLGLIPYTSGGNSSSLGTSGWPFKNMYATNHYGTNFDGSTTGVFKGHQLILQGTTDATMTSASTNPRITFQQDTGDQPVHLIYTDYDTYRAPAGLKVIGNEAGAWFEAEGTLIGKEYTSEVGVKSPSMTLLAHYNNEINFGGSNNSSTIYFGYRATGSKSIPTSFIFGGSTGTATLTSSGFKHSDYLDDNYLITANGGARNRNTFHQRYSFGGQVDYSGYWKININNTTSWMLSFKVRVYQGYNATEIQFSGHNYNTNHWYQPEARMIVSSDNASMTVYFGYDSDWNLWVAIPAGNYTGIEIVDVVNGYTQIDYNDLFTISNVSSLTGTTQTNTTIYPPVQRTASSIGSTTKGIYVNSSGNATAMTYSLSSTVNSGTANKLAYYSGANAISAYTTTVGGAAKPMYLNGGVPTACSSTVGSGIKPVYMSSGTITASSSTVGSSTQPVYMSSGTISGISYVSVAYGGTGKTSWTANQMIYPSAATTLSQAHYISSDRIAINSTSAPSYNLYVSGTSYISSRLTANKLTVSGTGSSWMNARNQRAITVAGQGADTGSWWSWIGSTTPNGDWSIGTYRDSFVMSYVATTDYDASTNHSTRMILSSAGYLEVPKIGINGVNSTYNLYVSGTGYFTSTLQCQSLTLTTANDSYGLFPASDNYSIVGSSSKRWWKGWFSSTVTAGSFNATSDARLKTNLRPFERGNILDLPVYKFDFIDGDEDCIGCLAQDLQKICPELVEETDAGYLTIAESKIVYLLLDKMKEMQAEINALKEGK